MGKDYQSGDRPAETHYESRPESAPPISDEAAPDSLLDEVLQHTIPTNSEPLSGDELVALQDVARQYDGIEFGLEPIGVALVDCLLQLRLPSGVRDVTPDMSHSIATAIFEAPEALSRLTKLWNQLCESVR
jgi:hypothetical protein